MRHSLRYVCLGGTFAPLFAGVHPNLRYDLRVYHA